MKKIVEPAILYRLYLENVNEKAQKFSLKLSETLGLQPFGDDRTWKHPQEDFQLKLLDPDLNDTLLVEIIWNAERDNHFWEKGSEPLHTAIQGLFNCLDANREDDPMLVIRGMTLFFQAKVSPDLDLNSIQCNEIMEETGLSYCHPGYSQTISGGRLWLLSVPQGELKKFVYLSLSTEEGEAEFWEELWDKKFIQKDLIVHKAFQCGRNYQRILEQQNVDNSIGSLTDSTKQVLDETDILSDAQSKQLANLARDYDTLLEASLELEIQNTSLAQQKSNYMYLVGQQPTNSIDNFLSQRITRFHHEVILKAEQCRHLLNGAEKATHIAQTRINEVKEQRRQRQEVWFAFLGITLAVPQILTYETVERLLNHFGIHSNTLMILTIQVVVTLIIAIGLAIIIWLVGKSRWNKSS
jgi:hypothetical protein